MSISDIKYKHILAIVNTYLEHPLSRVVCPDSVEKVINHPILGKIVTENYDIYKFREEIINKRLVDVQKIKEKLCLLANIIVIRTEFLINRQQMELLVTEKLLSSAIIAGSYRKTRKVEQAIIKRDNQQTASESDVFTERIKKLNEIKQGDDFLGCFIDKCAGPIYYDVLSISDDVYSFVQNADLLNKYQAEIDKLFNNPPKPDESDEIIIEGEVLSKREIITALSEPPDLEEYETGCLNDDLFKRCEQIRNVIDECDNTLFEQYQLEEENKKPPIPRPPKPSEEALSL